MRIIAGRWSGRALASPAGRVRPTAEPVREAFMQLLRGELEGARVLDLFAGTGALGLEALSRGAARCDFVENSAAALHALRANVAALRVRERTRIFDRDAIPFVESIPDSRYDIAVADPPYGSRKLDRIVHRWLEIPYSRWLAVEHAADHLPGARGRTRRVEDSSITLIGPARVSA
ncbi:MAG: RsmD family RNA methyltransferase [Gemmatimonadetes bacterium]|nr:RsmD family RNA methyltransferase [Gemmatimonadota bacterium]